MSFSNQYVAILRCQTWHVWPNHYIAEDKSFIVECDSEVPLCAQLAILTYEPRSAPEKFTPEPTTVGPLLWDGNTSGLHIIRDTILKAPEDEIELSWQHKNSHRGEIDICISFRYLEDIPAAVKEALQSATAAVMSLINLRFKDFLIPVAPFQIRKILPNNSSQITSEYFVSVYNRLNLTCTDLQNSFTDIAHALKCPTFGPKFITALELYAAHFKESQVRVRFLLLVVAIESVSISSKKHAVAIDLLTQWKSELEDKIKQYPEHTEPWESLDAIRRELNFRENDSIANQIRKLFAGIAGISSEESLELQRKATRVYHKRCTLVHDGHVPITELIKLEDEARELLEKVFMSAISFAKY